jgi:hypothetical protein
MKDRHHAQETEVIEIQSYISLIASKLLHNDLHL